MTDWRDAESETAKAAARRRLEWRATLRQQLPRVERSTDPIVYLQRELGAQVVSVTRNPRRTSNRRKAA
jgi:hypothetical protein